MAYILYQESNLDERNLSTIISYKRSGSLRDMLANFTETTRVPKLVLVAKYMDAYIKS